MNTQQAQDLRRLAEAATRGPWEIVDGYYPQFKELSGLSFKVSVVMWANDMTEKDYQDRDADLNYLAAMSPDVALQLLAERAMLLKAMHKLARLGNGEHFGNSEGNMIARAAIAQCEGDSNGTE